MIKRITASLLIACCTLTVFAKNEQANVDGIKYRRSSLSMVMLDTNDLTLTGDVKTLVVDAITERPIPDKFFDHNLDSLTTLNVKYLPEVSKEEISKYQSKSEASIAAAADAIEKAGLEIPISQNPEYIAKLVKYMEENYVANKIIAKWFNISTTPRGSDNLYLDVQVIEDRGMEGVTAEEKELARKQEGGFNKLAEDAINDMVPRSFVVVTRYEFMSAQELIQYLVAPTQLGVALASEKAASGSNPLAAKALDVAKSKAQQEIEKYSSAIQGYFVRTNTYLFQLEWNKDVDNRFNSLDWTKATTVDEFMKDKSYKMIYVGHTSKYAPAGMSLSMDDKTQELVKRSAIRSTDAAIANLQKEYDVFKTLVPVYVEGSDVYAKIGVNDGVSEKSKYEIVEITKDNDGNYVYKKKQGANVIPGKIWDNREGAGIEIDGEGTTDEEIPACDPNLKGTYFSANAKKIIPGYHYLRQVK